MKYATLDIDHTGDWATVWLNRPESRNALTAELARDLTHVLQRFASDPQLRGVTLRGRGGVFCAGGDLKAFRAMSAEGAAETSAVAAHNRAGGEMFHRLNTLPQTVLVLVEGAAMAGGLGMACCADVVAVTADAQFALTETTLGIPPAQIAPIVAARLGMPAARRLMLTAARFSGQEALQIGLADHVAADAAGLDGYAATIRAQVRRCAPGANAATKRILHATGHLQGAALREFAAEEFAACLLGPEGREGLQAFIEKRHPSWATPPASESQA